jgi:hypothetical protein
VYEVLSLSFEQFEKMAREKRRLARPSLFFLKPDRRGARCSLVSGIEARLRELFF